MELNGSPIRPLPEVPDHPAAQTAPAGVDLDLSDQPVVSPVVSIVVVGHDLERTARCLQAIALTAGGAHIEVIVVVADSNAELANHWAGHPNAVIERVPTALSIVQATNVGVARTRAPFVGLVDEEIDVSSGWLRNLMGLFDVWPQCGIAGGRIDTADGTIAEAGRIVWRNGSIDRCGAGARTNDHRFAHAREVDAVGGGIALVRRVVWENGPGLDEQCESVDEALISLAFSARACGHTVAYQPTKVATQADAATRHPSAATGHVTGQRSGTQLSARWASELAGQPPRPERAAPIIRHLDRRQQDRILIASAGITTVGNGRRSSRVLSLVGSLLRQDYAISVVMSVKPGDGAVDVLRRIGVEVCLHSDDPRSAIEQRVPELRAAIVSGPDATNVYLPMLAATAPTVPVAYDLAESRSLGCDHSAHRGEEPGHREHAVTEFERAAMRSADLVIVGSRAQAAVVEQIESATETMVFPELYSVPRTDTVWSSRRGVVVISDDANVSHDGLVWLLLAVMPLVWAEEPNIDLHIVGVDPSPDLTKLLDSRVHVHGSDVDVDALHDRVIARAVPSFEDADGHDSAIEGAVRGLPVIATTCGAPEPANGVLIADAADDFANTIVRLHRDDVLWEKAARSMVKEFRLRFGPGSIDWAVADCLSRLGSQGPHHRAISHGVSAAHFVR